MAWIEYHTALRDHWKVQLLADGLGCEYAHALGYVSCLWLWCAEYSPKGDLSSFNDSQISSAARCKHEKFSKNFLKICKLIDKKDRINDWHKHGIKLLVSKRNSMKKYRKNVAPRLRHRDTTVVHNLTVPNLTKPIYIRAFAIPTHDEIKTYCNERKNKVDHIKFHDFYTSKGWMVGKNKMKDWKAAVRNWEKTSFTDEVNKPTIQDPNKRYEETQKYLKSLEVAA